MSANLCCADQLPAAELLTALERVRHRLLGAAVCLVAPARLNPIEQAEFDGFCQSLPQLGARVSQVRFDDVEQLYRQPALGLLTDSDVAVKFTHGAFNRTGWLPAVLRSLGVRCAGHHTSTDLLSQRRSLVKQMMVLDAVPTLPYLLIAGGVSAAPRLRELAEASGTSALVVKPDDGNAGEGLHYAASVPEADELVRAGTGLLLVEPYRRGRIVTVGTMSIDGQEYPLAPLEYLLDERPVNATAWKKDSQRAPARLEPHLDAEVRRYAATLHRAVAATGMSRSDFIIAGDGTVAALGIDTTVGLAAQHDLAQAFTASGLRYEDLVAVQTAGNLPTPGRR